jgi:hypothetical protein
VTEKLQAIIQELGELGRKTDDFTVSTIWEKGDVANLVMYRRDGSGQSLPSINFNLVDVGTWRSTPLVEVRTQGATSRTDVVSGRAQLVLAAILLEAL